MRHGNAGLAILALVIVGAVLLFSCQAPTPDTMSPPSDAPAITHFPIFDCQEDEIMAWTDARHTAACVNIEEFRQMDILEFGRSHNGH